MHDIYIAFTSVVVCFADTCTHSVPIFNLDSIHQSLPPCMHVQTYIYIKSESKNLWYLQSIRPYYISN